MHRGYLWAATQTRPSGSESKRRVITEWHLHVRARESLHVQMLTSCSHAWMPEKSGRSGLDHFQVVGSIGASRA